MLHKSWISDIQIYTEKWDEIRKGKFTSSRIHAIMGDKPLLPGAMTYIYQKAGEFVTKQTLADDSDVIIEDENTAWGLQYEPEALNFFGLIKNLKYLITQKIIFDPNGHASSTPDALWVMDTSVFKEDCYNVATVEVKCPRKYHKFFPLFECQTPEDLKKFNKNYFWQVVDQMTICQAAIGYFVCYHPLFPVPNNIRIIEFKKIDLWKDFILLEQRKTQAIEKMKELILRFRKN